MTNGIPALSTPAAMSCLGPFSLLFIQDVPLFLDVEKRIHTVSQHPANALNLCRAYDSMSN